MKLNEMKIDCANLEEDKRKLLQELEMQQQKMKQQINYYRTTMSND